MIKCIKWLRRIIIAGFVFMISVYSISYIIEAPDLNGGHIIRMYDQNQQLFYQSQQQSNDVQLKDVSPYFLRVLWLLKIIVFMNIVVLIPLVFYVLLKPISVKMIVSKEPAQYPSNMPD